MVKFNGTIVGAKTFPNGERIFKGIDDLIYHDTLPNIIEFYYTGAESFETIMLLIGYLNDKEVKQKTLFIPYLPYLRADRKVGEDPDMKFGMLNILFRMCCGWNIITRDPHSEVPNWINEESLSPYVKIVLEFEEVDLVCYPDDGAKNRYESLSDSLGIPNIYAQKHRDPMTGKIVDIKLSEDYDLTGKKILIIDDIVSYGGTANSVAKQLQANGAIRIVLFVSHTEDSFFSGTIPVDGYINAVYTTQSIQVTNKGMVAIVSPDGLKLR